MRDELRAADGGCVSVRVPAKANLFLAVRGQRRDGYHELVTVMQTVSVFDRLQVGVLGPPGRGHHPATRRRMQIELWADDEDLEGLPPSAENLAVRAAEALGRSAGVIGERSAEVIGERSAPGQGRPPRTVIELEKAIPIAGGMAGGSADAAATLVALNQLWGCELDRNGLRAVAAELGSDVPFCVVGGTALATGTGAALAQVLCRGTFHWVVGVTRQPLSTAAVYRQWDALCRPSVIEPDAVLAALRTEDAEALGGALHNDLEPATFALLPELEDKRKALLDAGALGAIVSGSGPTLLALASSAEHAEAIAAAVAQDFDAAFVAHSPAGGPDVQPC